MLSKQVPLFVHAMRFFTCEYSLAPLDFKIGHDLIPLPDSATLTPLQLMFLVVAKNCYQGRVRPSLERIASAGFFNVITGGAFFTCT